MQSLTLEAADLIANKSLERGMAYGFAPLTVVILDAGGQSRSLNKKMDRASFARTSPWGKPGVSSEWDLAAGGFCRRAAKMPAFFNALSDLSGGRMVPVPGGVLIRSASGEIIGSVGISGDTSDNDETCAVYGIKSAGLTPDTGDKE